MEELVTLSITQLEELMKKKLTMLRQQNYLILLFQMSKL